MLKRGWPNTAEASHALDVGKGALAVSLAVLVLIETMSWEKLNVQ